MTLAKQFIHPAQVLDAYHNNVLDNSKGGATYTNQYNFDRYEEQRRQNIHCGGVVQGQLNNISASNQKIEQWNKSNGVTTIYTELIQPKGQPPVMAAKAAKVVSPLTPVASKPVVTKTARQVLEEAIARNRVVTPEVVQESAPAEPQVVEKTLTQIIHVFSDGSTQIIDPSANEKSDFIEEEYTLEVGDEVDDTWTGPKRTGRQCARHGTKYKSIRHAEKTTGVGKYHVEKNCNRNIDGWYWL